MKRGKATNTCLNITDGRGAETVKTEFASKRRRKLSVGREKSLSSSAEVWCRWRQPSAGTVWDRDSIRDATWVRGELLPPLLLLLLLSGRKVYRSMITMSAVHSRHSKSLPSNAPETSDEPFHSLQRWTANHFGLQLKNASGLKAAAFHTAAHLGPLASTKTQYSETDQQMSPSSERTMNRLHHQST